MKRVLLTTVLLLSCVSYDDATYFPAHPEGPWQITADETHTIVTAHQMVNQGMAPNVGYAFALLDANHDGVITTEEVTENLED